MKIRHKLYLTTGILGLQLLSLVAALFMSTAEIKNQERRHDLVESTQRSLAELQSISNEYLLYHEERMKVQWFSKFEFIRTQIASLGSGGTSTQPMFRALNSDLDIVKKIFSEICRNYEQRNLEQPGGKKRTRFFSQQLAQRQIAQLSVRSQAIAAGVDQLSDRVHSGVEQAQKYAVKLIASFSFVFLLTSSFAITFWIFVIGYVMRDIRNLIREIQLLGRGHRSRRIQVRSHDEIAEIASSFNEMASNLEATTVSRDQLVVEVEERKRAEKDRDAGRHLMNLMSRVTYATNEALTTNDALRSAVEIITEFTGARVGHAYLPNEEGSPFRASSLVWYQPIDTFPFVHLKEIAESEGLPSVGVARNAFQDKAPRWRENGDSTPLSAIETAAFSAGLPGCFAFPILIRREVGAVLEFFSSECQSVGSAMAETFSNIGIQLGRVLERKRADDLKSRLATIVQCSPDAIIGATSDGTVTAWNQGAETLFGYSAQEIVGKSIRALHSDEKGLDLLRVVAQGVNLQRIETRRMRKDGRWVDISLQVAPLRSTDGQVTGFCAFAHDITEQKRARELLTESEERHRRIVDSAQDAFIAIDSSGKVIDWNAQAELTFGWAREEVLGCPVDELVVPPLDRTKYRTLFENFVERGEGPLLDRRMELSGYNRAGKIFPVELTLSGIRIRDAMMFAAFIHDISARKRNEARLKESEARFRLLFDNNPHPMWLTDPLTWEFLEVNESAIEKYGYSREEFLKMTALQIRPPEEAARFLQEAESRGALANGYRNGGEWRHQLKDGRITEVEIASYCFELNGRNVELTAISDITDRKNTERLLREREARLRVMVEQMPAIVWTTDRDLKVVFSAGQGVTGFTNPPEPLGGRTLDSYISASDPEHPALGAHQRALLGESVAFEGDWLGRTFASYVEPMHDEKHSVTGCIGVALDITERKRIEEDLRQLAEELSRSNRELEEFAYIASHDLQEPLRMVTCYLNLLKQRCGSKLDSDALDFVGFAFDGAQRMKDLIGALLSYSRVGNQAKVVGAVSCESLLSTVLSNLKVAVEESGARVTFKDMPTVRADQVQLAQLFQNLLSNAIKFRTGEPPRIQVSADVLGSDWLFTVTDNGIGIPPESVDRIFNIFQRLHGRDEYPGTGVGLAICKKIVQRHGGRIWVDSLPGKGSRFCFTLPRNS